MATMQSRTVMAVRMRLATVLPRKHLASCYASRKQNGPHSAKLFNLSCSEPRRSRRETTAIFSGVSEDSASDKTDELLQPSHVVEESVLELGSFNFVLPLMLFATTAESSGGPGYSLASYYTSLGLFVISVPGVWSLVKRSAKSKVVQKTFLIDGPAKPGSKPLNKLAGEITSTLSRRNFSVVSRGDVAVFEGILTPSRSQAAFLVFCTSLSLLSVALVLSIALPDIGNNWYLLAALSPLSGLYYWQKATRKEEIKVKMVLSDDEQSADVIIQGDDSEVDMLRKELGLMEKGMVYVKGILE